MLQTIHTRQFSTLVAIVGVVLFAAAIVLLPTSAAVVLIGGIFFLLGSMRWQRLAICALVFAIPFGSLFPLTLAGANLTAADGLALLALLLFYARRITHPNLLFKRAGLVIPFIIFIFATSLSLISAPSLPAGAKELLKWIEMLVVYWLVVQEFAPSQLPSLLAVILLAGLAEAALGFYQFFFRAGPAGFLLFDGNNLRAFGTFEQPNPYAGYLGLIIPLAFGTVLGFLTTRARDEIKLPRSILFWLALMSLGAMSAALFFSLSRGAWLAASAAVITIIVLYSRRAAVIASALVILIAMIAILGQLNFIPDVVTERFKVVGDYFGFQDVRHAEINDATFAIVERMAHWQAAWDMFVNHPLLGVGIGNYAVAYPAYALPQWQDPLGHAHNYYLNVLAEAGVIGLSAYLILWGAIFWSAWRALQSTRGLWRGVVAGALGVLVALSIHNFFDNLFVHSLHIQVGITLGMVEAFAKVESRKVES